MSERQKPADPLRAALAQIAAADAPELVEQARNRANARARDVIEEELVRELLRAAGRLYSRDESRRSIAAANEQPSSDDQAWWAYCVIRAEDAAAIPHELEGIEPGSHVQILTEGELAALVSEVPLEQYNDERLREHLEDLAWVERTARAHEAVLERALSSTTIVPLRLCTLYRDPDGVRRLLRESSEALIDGLASVEGCVELGVKVFALPEQAAAASVELAGGSAQRSDPSTERAGAAYLSRRQHERDLAEQARELRAQCAQVVHERVAALSRAAATNPPQRREAHGREGEMLLNGAYLVARDRVSEIGEAIADLRVQWEPAGFDVELTGPWPAYNFVSGAAGIVP